VDDYDQRIPVFACETGFFSVIASKPQEHDVFGIKSDKEVSKWQKLN